ncbi:MAG: FecR family protein [Chitinophagaceae bacterium]
MPEERIYRLATLFFQGTITEAEHAELAEWISRSESDAALTAVLSRAWDEYQPGADVVELATDRLRLPEIIHESYPLQNSGAGEDDQAPVKNGFFRNSWLRVAAILVLFAAAGTAYFLLSEKEKPSDKIVDAPTPVIEPGGNKALLTLADGSVIVLDSAGNGDLAAQGGVKIVKQDGVVTYIFEPSQELSASENLLNTISTPRKGEYHIILPDGSKAWLNAESSITFPVKFAANERKVSVTGEVYFEVRAITSGSGKIPFLVDIKTMGGNNDAQVQVLGTHFNINAYNDEAFVRTTLLEGSVTVAREGKSTLLKPGQQARIANGGKVDLQPNVDTEEVMAWRKGMFFFSNADIRTVMRQIARWYDVDVVFEGKLPDERFEGTIPRNTTLQEVVEILKQSNLHIKLEGRKATVLP